jgi:tetratricopeptide (TPR) repeat protein
MGGLCQESGCRIVLKGADKFIKGGLPMDTPRKKSEFGWRPFEGIDQLFSNLPAGTETQSPGGSEPRQEAGKQIPSAVGAGPSAGAALAIAAAASPDPATNPVPEEVEEREPAQERQQDLFAPDPGGASSVSRQADEDDFLLGHGLAPGLQEHARKEVRRSVAEAEELIRENRWEDLIALFHPLEEKVPAAVDAGIDLELRLKVAFALGQSGRFEEALKALEPALRLHPDDFHVHSAAGFNAYQSLLKRRERKVTLIPEQKRERIQQAHEHFRRCQQLRPDHVTSFYREGMLFKEVEGKTLKAAACFRQAIRNWESLSEEERQKRHQERPKYLRSLYHLASCLLEAGESPRARELLERCMQEDSGDVLSPVHKHFAMAKVLHAMARYREALEYLETAGRAARDGEPTDYIWELAARCCLHQGRAAEGMRYLARIPERIRKPYVRWTEADLLVALGRGKEAEEVLTRSAERDRRSRHKALLRLAYLHYRQGLAEQALEKAREANRFYRQTYGNECQDALFWIVGCLHKLGRRDEALRTLAELEGLNPQYPNLYRLKERVRGGHDHG